MGDDVQRSLELLDRVLSEFDDLENGNPPVGGGGGNGNGGGNGGGGGGDDSPSLHSEDDGYMSMNGRRAKFVLNLRPQVQMPGGGNGGLPLPEPPPPDPPPPNLLRRLTNAPTASADSLQFPPPPEEAERIISTLLPRVSPGNSSKRSSNGFRRPYNGSLKLGNGFTVEDHHVTTATQTTLPKTRHQRPYGWENGPTIPANYHPNHQSVNPAVRFGSLPYDGSLQWMNPLPPRTLPTAMDRHREVRRRGGGGGEEPAEGGGEAITQQLRIVTETCDDDAANFSDDSLEELLPPPPPPLTKRGSIAWEVPLDMDDEALLTPGSTKVIGRRRRRSTDRSSTGSMTRLKDQDEWPDPPTGTEDGSLSPFSDSSHLDSMATSRQDESSITLPPELNASDLSSGGTYIIRKGRRKERKPLQGAVSRASSKSSINSTKKNRLSPPKFGEMKRCSSTFDNIKSLLKDGLIEGLDDDPPDFAPPTPPPMLKVVSLPSLLIDDNTSPSAHNNRTINRARRHFDERLSPELNTVKHKSQGKTVVDSSTKVSIDVGVQVTDDFSSIEPSTNEQKQSENVTVSKAEISTQIQPEELTSELVAEAAKDVAVEVVCENVEAEEIKPESEKSKIKDESVVISEPQVVADPITTETSEVISQPQAVADPVRTETSEVTLQPDLIIRPVRKSISLEENCVFRKALPLEPDSFYEKELPLEPDSIDYDKALPQEPVEVYDKDLPSEPYDEKLLPPVPPPSSRESDVESLSGREMEENEKNSTGTMILHVEIGKEKAVFNPWNKAKEAQVIPVLEEDRKLKIEDEHENEKRDDLKSEKPPAEFNVKVEVLQHEFGPLPPSPVEEDEDEYADILRPSPVKTDEPFYRCVEPPASDPIGSRFLNRPPEPPPHRDATSSLKTRSMDAGFTRNHKNQHSASRKEIPSERRTLPSELPGPSRRRTFQKRTNTCSSSGQSPREESRHMQVSCSLPETPIFARGCDIPRTPLRRTPEVTPGSARTAPRPGGLQTTGSYRMTAGHGTVGSGVSLGQAMVGAELLRLNGGPGRGWYPRHRQQPRPASVEHLDHLARSGLSPSVLSPPGSAWDSSRKPLTLPPNLTPKFFQRSPREALRRVTSLLIRKGNSSKDQKKEVLSPTQGVEPGDGRQKRGFFKSFWKKSRQYSLEQQ